MTIYGSSPVFGIKVQGLTGLTGIKGPTGIAGTIGPTGPSGKGATGPSIIGMTLDSNGIIVTSYDDTRAFGAVNKLIGETGSYYLPADADVLSAAFNIISGVSYYTNNSGKIQNEIHLRGITTSTTDVIKIRTVTSSSQDNIVIDYSIFNLAYLGVSGGSAGQILYNKPGDKQFGLTGTFFNQSTTSSTAQVANYSERICIVDPTFKVTPGGAAQGFYYWKIDHDAGNIFKLNPWADNPEAAGKDVLAQMLYIKSPTNELFSKGINIIVPSGVTSGNTHTTLYATTENLSVEPDIETFEENISWPITIPPCFTENVDIINMISIGDVWHASFSHLGFTFGVENDVVGEVNKKPNLIPLEEVNFDCKRGNNIFGLCCPSICGVNPYETIEVLCEGIFYPGLTLLDPCYICEDLGVCCITQPDGQIIKIPYFVEDCECFALANGQPYNWILKDDTITSPSDVNCDAAKRNTGACCRSGVCTEETESSCTSDGGSFQGSGTICESGAGNRCTTGLGACCNPTTGTCTPDLTNEQCIAQSGSYRGAGTSCLTESCVPTCFAPLSGGASIALTPGTEFEGGIVVGVFKPKNTRCLGNTAFGGVPLTITDEIQRFNFLTNGDIKPAQEYLSKYNPTGYGFTLSSSHNCDEDSWLLLVSKFPVILTANPIAPIKQDLVDTTTPYVSTFTWSNGGTYFGFIMNEQGQIPSVIDLEESIANEDFTRDEGFYAFKVGTNGVTYFGNDYSFANCNNNNLLLPVNRSANGIPTARITMNGKWNHSWGIYNTIRMTCAERHAYKLDIGYQSACSFGDGNSLVCNLNEIITFGAGFTSTYGNDWTLSQQSSAEAISAFNYGYTPYQPNQLLIPELSDWYLPSIDELSFIAYNIANNNLNGKIALSGGIPIGDTTIRANGWVWSSTGTFNEANPQEYTQTQTLTVPPPDNATLESPVKAGTEAWAMQFNSANLAAPQIGKQNRLDRYEVRPVRFVRCDRRYYIEGDESRLWRHWKIPILPINTVIGTFVGSGGGGGPV